MRTVVTVVGFCCTVQWLCEFYFRVDSIERSNGREKTRSIQIFCLLSVDRLTSANPNRIVSEPVLERTVCDAETAMIASRWRFAKPAVTSKSMIPTMILVFAAARRLIWRRHATPVSVPSRSCRKFSPAAMSQALCRTRWRQVAALSRLPRLVDASARPVERHFDWY